MKTSVIFITCLLLLSTANFQDGLALERQDLSVGGYTVELQVPRGMRLEFVAPLDGPRFISKGPDDELIIGSKGAVLYRLKFPYTQVETILGPSGFLHSAVYQQEKLFVAETAGVWSAPYRGIVTNLEAGDFSKVVPLPSTAGGHSSRTIVSGPDNRLYIGIGISGNCSNQYLHNSYAFENRRGGVFVLDASDSLHPYSAGLRNPIGLAFHPQTAVLYATNAGPDNLGYDRPPEVLASLSHGSFHGMPWFQYYDGSFKSGECIEIAPPRPANEAEVPVVFFPARSTPEGITFLAGSSLGRALDNSAAVAIHGSWATVTGQGKKSRRPPQLSLVIFDKQKPVKVTSLIVGFQRSDGSRFARPCGVIVGGDGHLYFTSDGGEVTGLFRLVPVESSTSTALGLLLDDASS